MDRTVTFKQEETSGHEPRTGLDTKTDRLTDRQSQCDSDSDSDKNSSNPCGGGAEYLHRDPASRRRRRKGKSQI
jgi:hypothetical protein